MRHFRHIFVFFAICGILVAAPDAAAFSAFQADSVSIKTKGSKALSVLPGKVVTIVYEISSDATEEATYTPHLELPEGWSIVIGSTPLLLSPGKPTIRFMTFKVPASAVADEYPVTLHLVSDNEVKQATHRETIEVSKVYSLSLDVKEIPPYAPAGQIISTELTLFNSGNTSILVQLEAKERDFARVKIQEATVKLAPGEVLSTEAHIHTDANLELTKRASIQFEAVALGHDETRASTSVSFEIVPVYSKIRPKQGTLPISLVVETIGDETGIAPQARISGSAPLMGGNVTVSASLAEFPRQKFYGSEQVLALEYKKEGTTLKLGDHSQSMSPLTLSGEQGVGAGLEVESEKWNVKASVQRSRHIFPAQERAGLSVTRILNPTTKISSNLLHRNGLYQGTILTTRAQSRPFGQTSRLDIECGVDSHRLITDPSCSLLLSQSTRAWSSRIRVQRGSETFPGVFAGMKQISEFMSVRLSPQIRLDNNIRWMNRGQEDIFSRSNLFFKGGVTYTNRLRKGTMYFTVHGIRSNWKYESILSSISRIEKTLRLTGSYQLSRIGLTVSTENGRAQSDKIRAASSLFRFKSNLRATIRNNWSLNASFEKSGGNLSEISTHQRQTSFGLGTSFTAPFGVYVTTTGFHSRVQTTLDQQYTSFRVRASKGFRSGHVLTVQSQINRSTGRQTVQSSDFKVSYALPLALPFAVSDTPESLLRGQVIDKTSGQPVEGVLIFLGDKLSITDRQGRFAIPRTLSNVDYLRIDAKSIGFNRTPIRSFPLEIGPDDFQHVDLVISLVHSARITGSIDVYGPVSASDHLLGDTNTEFTFAGGLAGAIIQISDSSRRLRTRTSQNGSFEFNNLPPGTYTVEVIRSQLVGHQRFTTRKLEITVGNAEEKDIQFKVIPFKKQIRIIKTSTLSTTPLPTSTSTSESQDKIADPSSLSGQGSRKDPALKEALDAKMSRKTETSTKSDRTSWFNMMHDSAQDDIETNAKDASLLPFWVSVTTPPPGSSPPPFLHIWIFILGALFFLIVFDLILRHIIEGSQPSSIHKLTPSSWIWASRQSAIYALVIGTVTSLVGPLAGLAVSLALAGISVTIETKETYKNIYAILVLSWSRGIKLGQWVAYRDSVGRVTSFSLSKVELTLHGNTVVALAPFALLHVSISSWLPEEVRNERWTISVSRMSNLRSIRTALTETISQFAPEGTRHHSLIQFKDIDTQTTSVSIESVIDGNRTSKTEIKRVLLAELAAIGIELFEESPATEASQVGKPEENAYPPLRLVQGNRNKAA